MEAGCMGMGAAVVLPRAMCNFLAIKAMGHMVAKAPPSRLQEAVSAEIFWSFPSVPAVCSERC